MSLLTYNFSSLGFVHKLRLQDEVGRWSKNVNFLSTFIQYKMLLQEGRWSNKAKIEEMRKSYIVAKYITESFLVKSDEDMGDVVTD